MIDQADNVLLADFGLANVIEATGRVVSLFVQFNL